MLECLEAENEMELMANSIPVSFLIGDVVSTNDAYRDEVDQRFVERPWAIHSGKASDLSTMH